MQREHNRRVSSQPELLAAANEWSKDRFPGLLGLQITGLGEGTVEGQLEVRPNHLAPNGYLHAGVVIGLADTLCGYGCIASLPDGANNFATIELKSNFLATAREGLITGQARLTHGGRTTQLWDATVTDSSGKTMALFRCTQLILYPRKEP
jgi:1,4-dihydroxy-2-naphthoyl-CoA hydrolase